MSHYRAKKECAACDRRFRPSYDEQMYCFKCLAGDTEFSPTIDFSGPGFD